MRLTSLKLWNYGPYLGDQMVDLSTDHARSIIVVHGDNMRGKTSFLNSIKWVLYGHAEDRTGRRMPRRDLINWQASAAGNWTMNVAIDFEHGGSMFRLERHLQPKPNIQAPHMDQDFDEKMFLQKDHVQLSNVEDELGKILPEGISLFFLFDGEMLGKYEELLADQQMQSLLVRDSIEDILGVPAITHAIADLTVNRREAAKHQATLARKQTASQVYAANAERLDSEVESLEESVTDLKEQMLEQQGKLDQLDDKLKATAGLEADAERLARIKEDLVKFQQAERDLGDRRQELLAHSWHDLLCQHVRTRREALEEYRDSYIDRLRRSGELQTLLSHIGTISEGHACPTCGAAAATLGSAELTVRREQLEKELLALDIDDERFQGAAISIQRLRRLADSGSIVTIAEVERDLQKIRVQKADLEFKRNELNTRLEGHNSEDIVRNRADYRNTLRQVVALEGEINKTKDEISSKQAEAERNRAQIRGGSDPALARLNREVDLYQGLIAVFQHGLERLRAELKVAVEKDASDIFLQLTTDKTYAGLRINEHYGLTIVDGTGRYVTVRSAGAEQVVALALITALNRNAVRRGPVVMDTPFGRLDPGHRRNILDNLSNMAEQVIILVHEGEVVVEEDLLNSIRDRIAKEYDIAYVSSNESRIVPRRA